VCGGFFEHVMLVSCDVTRIWVCLGGVDLRCWGGGGVV